MHLSNKDVEYLEEIIRQAKTDWRDILMCAEYKYLGEKQNPLRIRDFNNEFGNEDI